MVNPDPQQLIIERLHRAASEVPDPELPFILIKDLGILRDISLQDTTVVARVSPTYSGCPAVTVIEQEIESALQRVLDDPENIELWESIAEWQVRVERQLAPAWTTDWITADGQRKLKANGIAPPEAAVDSGLPATASVSVPTVKDMSKSLSSTLFAVPSVACPYCESTQTERLSEFGSTPCKSQYRCLDCSEPFDHFKCLR